MKTIVSFIALLCVVIYQGNAQEIKDGHDRIRIGQTGSISSYFVQILSHLESRGQPAETLKTTFEKQASSFLQRLKMTSAKHKEGRHKREMTPPGGNWGRLAILFPKRTVHESSPMLEINEAIPSLEPISATTLPKRYSAEATLTPPVAGRLTEPPRRRIQQDQWRLPYLDYLDYYAPFDIVEGEV